SQPCQCQGRPAWDWVVGIGPVRDGLSSHIGSPKPARHSAPPSITVGRDVVLELVRRTGGAAGAPRGGAEKGEPGRQDVKLPPAADGAGARLRESAKGWRASGEAAG